jgi:thioredoxin-like negative regulator of GroEL
MDRIGEESFVGRRLRREGTWAVAFLADWCPFCRKFRPRFELLSLARGGRLIADLTAVESPLWDRFGIDVIPTVIVFREGLPGPRFDGVAGEGLDDAALAAIVSAVDGSAPRKAPTPARPGRARPRR